MRAINLNYIHFSGSSLSKIPFFLVPCNFLNHAFFTDCAIAK